MTVKDVYENGQSKLKQAGIEEYQLDAWYLLEYVTGISRAMYFADSGKEMAEEQQNRYFELLEQRAKRIPLQHLTGVQEFMGLEFLVNEHVLIPRQDTEILVETALDVAKKQCAVGKDKEQRWKLLDMCTGSGCILLSILFYMKENGADGEGIGADISPKALAVAEKNAARLGIKAEFLHSDLFEKVDGKFDMIVSNPPYIRTSELDTLQEEVKCHDPRIALDGMEDGLYFYRRIVDESRNRLCPGGYLIFEIGYDQADAVSEMMKSAGFSGVTVKKDLAGLDRVVFGVYDVIGKTLSAE